ncbi:MAG: hypothetical protein H6813_03770 [Phycisphaeraceae bacterium]|nr:hypothetical protein [Phycisphaeraceae bacterium]MCB9847065.1 hypothetical protein [Phycisphaeraceae bacterium]
MIGIHFFAAGALGAASLAGPAGMGTNTCHLTWDKQCCPVPGCATSIAPGVLTICNGKDVGAEYNWTLTDISGMGLSFMPSSGFTGLNPGECIDLPFTVICPPNFPLGSVADYEARVTKVSTGETISCFGNVRNMSDFKIDPPVPVVPVAVPADISVPAPRTEVRLSVSNIGSSGKDGVSLYVVPMGQFAVDPPVLPLPPIAAGASISDCRYEVFFDISLLRGAPPQQTMGDVLYMLDTTGDGVADTVIGSQTVRGVPQAAPCPGDLNGDGVVDTADLGILLGAFGTLCP